MNLQEMIAARNELEIANQAFLARLEAGETLTDEDNAKLSANVEEFDTLTAHIEQRERITAQTATLAEPHGRRTAPAPLVAGTVSNPGQAPIVSRPLNGKSGFDSFGSFSKAVINAAVNPQAADERLMGAIAGNNTATGSEGGYLVPPDFRDIIMEKITTEESLLGRTDGLQTVSNSITIPKSTTTQWDSSNGVQGYWLGQGGSITTSQAQLAQTVIPVHKLACLVPVTEEQMEDGPLIDSYLNRKVPDKLDWMISDAIINGNGTGKPLGILDAAAGGTVAETRTATAAQVVLHDDILGLWGHMYAPWRANSVWLINPAVEEWLNILAYSGAPAATGMPVYMPPGGLSASPYATLMGRPVIPHQTCAAAGSKGDIILADFSQYLSVTKTSGMRSDVSIHMYFQTDQSAFRFIIRVGGEPWYDEVVAANNGTYNQGAFVVLADGA